MVIRLFKNIFKKVNKTKNSVDSNKTQEMGLTDLVFSLYDYRMKKENIIKPKLLKNIRVKGKNIEHKIDVYVEFVQMNNLERTVIKTIDSKIVKAEDVWQFDNLLKDLGYFPKGVLYYNNNIDDEALNIADNRHIQVIHFDMMEETRKNVLQSLGQILPDRNVIGDPFWTLMEIDERTKNNIGNYFVIENSLPLFTSKKIAEACCKLKEGYAVFGISQKHLCYLISLVETGMYPYRLSIIRPSKQSSASMNYRVEMHDVEYKTIREIYVR
ncbi:hypothetical protein QE557_07725 [Streptococcus suis]|uniref:hypothetical protein n=1 Tax=Streptococcus suis TaxID=1307 RepID=UPI003758242F